MCTIAVCTLAVCTLAGCTAPADGAGARCAGPAPSGLRPIAYSYVGEGVAQIGHAREVALDGDLLFVADANGLPTLRWQPDGAGGSLDLLHAVAGERSAHCSSVALHAASRTLVCVAGDQGLVGLVDVRDPARPVVRPWPTEGLPPIAVPSVPDVAVAGDTVWLAGNELGLMRTALDAAGNPGMLELTEIGAAVLQVEIAGDRIVLLDRVEGIVVLDRSTLARLARVELPGPPIDLAIDGDRLVVSLGSEGVRVLELDADGVPRPVAEVQPRCVATAADVEGDQLAVACLTGLTLYALEPAGPRVIGFVPARYGMLDVVFAPFGLVVVDWYRLDVLEADPGGTVALPDVPRAMRLAPGDGAAIPIRNPGDDPLVLRWALEPEGGSPIGSGMLTVPGRGESILALSASDLESAGSAHARAEVVLRREGETCDDLAARTRIAHRGPDDEPARGRVAIGDRFPTLARSSPSPAPDALPIAGQAGLVMFLTVDCYLQWPQLEDMAWAQDHGSGPPPPTIFFLTTWNEDPFDPSFFMRNLGATQLLTVEWADYLGSVPGADAAENPVRAFEETFMMRLPGADFPHDYHVDAAGIVTATSRAYRGRWPLGE